MNNEYHDLSAFQQEAEAHFDNYYGQEVPLEENFEPDEGADPPDNYLPRRLGRIDPRDRTLTIQVENRSGAEQTAILLGGYEEEPQTTGVTVTVAESSHKAIRDESKSNPFKIVGLKMTVSDHLQLDKPLDIRRKKMTGSYSGGNYSMIRLQLVQYSLCTCDMIAIRLSSNCIWMRKGTILLYRSMI